MKKESTSSAPARMEGLMGDMQERCTHAWKILLSAISFASFCAFLWCALFFTAVFFRVHGGLLWLLGGKPSLAPLAGFLLKSWQTLLFWMGNASIEVVGAAHLPQKGPFLVVANHLSMFDIPLIMNKLTRPVGFVAKRELFWIPGLSYWMRHIGCYALNRNSRRGIAALYGKIRQDLQQSCSALVIFPEGTRSRTGVLGPFRPGALALSGYGDLPILPLRIENTQHLFTPRSRTHPIRLTIFPLLDSRAQDRGERRELLEKIRHLLSGGPAPRTGDLNPGGEP